jgi:hypothetical protein
MRKYRYVLCFAALSLGLIFSNLALIQEDKPSCPTEDSCYVYYDGGAWHIAPAHP